MTILKDITDLFERWDVWRRVAATPDRTDALEERIAQLEEKLQKAPGSACPKCGERDYRVENSIPHPAFGHSMGRRLHEMKCRSCGFTDTQDPVRK